MRSNSDWTVGCIVGRGGNVSLKKTGGHIMQAFWVLLKIPDFLPQVEESHLQSL